MQSARRKLYNLNFAQSMCKRWSHKSERENTKDLIRDVSEAESIVGYPTSFLNLRWLLNDEMANIAFQLKKLIGSKHPLLKTARNILIANHVPSWGLIVLLVSKAGGQLKYFSETEQDLNSGVLYNQRALAEVTEMIRTSNIIHKSMVNIDDSVVDQREDLNFGNKISILSGDHLQAKSFHELACIKDHYLNELMASALRDLVDADFIGPRDLQNSPIPAKPREQIEEVEIEDQFGTEPYCTENAMGDAKSEWTLRNILGGASLLGRSCQGALKLAGHCVEFQKKGYLFGKHLALKWKAHNDMEPFMAGASGQFSLISAPVLFYLQEFPESYNDFESSIDSTIKVDFEKLRRDVRASSALAKTSDLYNFHSKSALNVLKSFQVSDARSALKNIIKANP